MPFRPCAPAANGRSRPGHPEAALMRNRYSNWPRVQGATRGTGTRARDWRQRFIRTP
jgi:hypothetical protein